MLYTALMDFFTHYIPTPDLNYPHRAEKSYTGYSSVPFNVSIATCDLFDGRGLRMDYMSRVVFGSIGEYQAFMGGSWADVFASRATNLPNT